MEIFVGHSEIGKSFVKSLNKGCNITINGFKIYTDQWMYLSEVERPFGMKLCLNTYNLCLGSSQPEQQPEPEYEYTQVSNVTAGDKLYLNKETECLVIGWHPEQPMVVVDSGEGLDCVLMQDLFKRSKVTYDWRKEVDKFLSSCKDGAGKFNISNAEFHLSLSDKDFLKMCELVYKTAKKNGDV